MCLFFKGHKERKIVYGKRKSEFRGWIVGWIGEIFISIDSSQFSRSIDWKISSEFWGVLGKIVGKCLREMSCCSLWVTFFSWKTSIFSIGLKSIWYGMKEQRILYQMRSISLESSEEFLEKIRNYSENLFNSSMFFSLFLFEQRSNLKKIDNFFPSINRKKSSLSIDVHHLFNLPIYWRENPVLFHWIRIYSFEKTFVYLNRSSKERKEKRSETKQCLKWESIESTYKYRCLTIITLI